MRVPRTQIQDVFLIVEIGSAQDLKRELSLKPTFRSPCCKWKKHQFVQILTLEARIIMYWEALPTSPYVILLVIIYIKELRRVDSGCGKSRRSDWKLQTVWN
jgi:hypothetical protein